MRRILALVALTVVCGSAPAVAAEKCPLSVSACLEEFDKMRTRPWLGIKFARDSTTRRFRIREVVANSPAERSGMKAGDEILMLNGVEVDEVPKLIVGKAGWRTGDDASYRIRREGREQNMKVKLGTIPDEVLAQWIGIHMVEGHLAYSDLPADTH